MAMYGRAGRALSGRAGSVVCLSGRALAGRGYSSSVPEVMRAAVVHETGEAEVLTLEEAWAVPTLADGQVGPRRSA